MKEQWPYSNQHPNIKPESGPFDFIKNEAHNLNQTLFSWQSSLVLSKQIKTFTEWNSSYSVATFVCKFF